jgi:lycopene cyclase domain-containing protein
MSLYLLINILSIAIPLVLSFDRRVHYYTYWKFLIPSIFITLLLFIVWDVIFTAQGVWGFNERYYGQTIILGLPLEEFLFFITVPYASVFIIYVLDHYFPNYRTGRTLTPYISYFLMASLVLVAILNLDKTYTAVNFFATALVIGLVLVRKPVLLRNFYPSYLIILIPFLIVNGILTGSFIDEQVVWYNNQENLGIRLGTIPLEDVFYGMTLILLNYFLTETFRDWRQKLSR